MVVRNDEKLARVGHAHARHINPEWRRHPADLAHWHHGQHIGGSFTGGCNVRWCSNDESEISERPPFGERCDLCERVRLERVRIELGLAELARNAPAHEDWASAHLLDFDFGGES